MCNLFGRYKTVTVDQHTFDGLAILLITAFDTDRKAERRNPALFDTVRSHV